MPPIRTLLWIGPADELAALGVLDAPTLDVVWVESVEALKETPPLALDAIVLGDAARPAAAARTALETLDRAEVDAPVLALRAAPGGGERARLAAAGAPRVLDIEGSGDTAMPRLLAAIESLLQHPRRPPAQRGAPSREAGPELVGSSRAIQAVEQAIGCAAGSPAPVLVLGETGSGKEIVARRIHAQSPRRAAAFVAVNCAAFADTLLESELFGHRRGAFTGADRDRVGLFERATGGTVFLDEIGETSAALQARLLRVLQEREVLPVGGDRPRSVDVRIVAATHRNLGREIEARRFREDLFYRLAVLTIELPPLRARRSDVARLAAHFLSKHGERDGRPGCALSPRALSLLERHDWPGNVRELENEMQRVLALAAPGELITARRLSPALRRDPQSVGPAHDQTARLADGLDDAETLTQALDRIEAGLIRDALDRNAGRRARTARRLGITREGLYKKMKRLGIG